MPQHMREGQRTTSGANPCLSTCLFLRQDLSCCSKRPVASSASSLLTGCIADTYATGSGFFWVLRIQTRGVKRSPLSHLPSRFFGSLIPLEQRTWYLQGLPSDIARRRLDSRGVRTLRVQKAHVSVVSAVLPLNPRD